MQDSEYDKDHNTLNVRVEVCAYGGTDGGGPESTADMRLDPAATNAGFRQALDRLVEDFTADELNNILPMAVALHQYTNGTWGECLYSAIIFERG